MTNITARERAVKYNSWHVSEDGDRGDNAARGIKQGIAGGGMEFMTEVHEGH